MNFKTGDKVRFLNEVGEGRVVGFEDNSMALVEMEDGFEIPMKISELLKVEGDEVFHQETSGMKQTIAENEIIDNSIPDQAEIKNEDGVYLAIVKKNIDRFTLNIVNDTDYQLNYHICKNNVDDVSYINGGQLEDNTKLIIETYNQQDLTNLDDITFQGILFSKKNFILQDPIIKTINISKVILKNKSFKVNDFYDDNAMFIKLENDDMKKEIEKLTKSDINAIITTKEQKPQSVGDFLKKPKKNGNEPEEVDLHIESIVDDYSDMQPAEIIRAQLSRFEIALDGAIRNNTRRIVFIHGVGNGKLKYELGKILDRKHPDLRYQDASFKEYGYGAMLVIIK